jgi:hypothetical protein
MQIAAIIKASLLILSIIGVVCAGYSNERLDTLYQYYMGYTEQHISHVVLQNEEELTSFLQKTGYDNEKALKKPSITIDFGKLAVFAFAGWPCTIITILEDSANVTVQYREDYRDRDPNDRRKYMRPSNVVAIYAIPNTSKKILFKDVTGNK